MIGDKLGTRVIPKKKMSIYTGVCLKKIAVDNCKIGTNNLRIFAAPVTPPIEDTITLLKTEISKIFSERFNDLYSQFQQVILEKENTINALHAEVVRKRERVSELEILLANRDDAIQMLEYICSLNEDAVNNQQRVIANLSNNVQELKWTLFGASNNNINFNSSNMFPYL